MTENEKMKEADEFAKARLAARLKTPADYDMAVTDDRTSSEVAADLARLRLELTATVDELTAKLDPKVIGTEIKVKAKKTAKNAGKKAKNFGNDLMSGDKGALKILGISTVCLITLILLRKFGK